MAQADLTGFEIKVCEHQLGVGKARFALHSNLVREKAELRSLLNLHLVDERLGFAFDG